MITKVQKCNFNMNILYHIEISLFESIWERVKNSERTFNYIVKQDLQTLTSRESLASLQSQK